MAVPISNVTRRQVYSPSGTGGAGPYSFTFEILANTDIAVYKDDTLLTLTTHYTVTINSNGTGSVTITAAGLALSPTSPTQYAIVGNRTIQRTTDFTTGGDFFANTVNDELDQQTIFAQQNAEGLQRTIQAPQTDPTSINMTLPRASVRANKTLAFDTAGNPTTGEVIGDNRGNWAAATTYSKRDIVKDTSNGNIYYANTAHTSSGSQPISTNADSAKWDLLVDNASAGTSATAAAASASAAATSASNASTSATNAASSASGASTSASNASTSATNAANSATAAAASASTASTQASNASTSATNAATSATNASNSASGASTSATNAASSASSASTSASNASTSATNAASSASSASTSANNASTSATNASNSATAAATSETNAAASAAAAAASFDAFDDIYLGAKSSDPSVDNDGNALTTGDQYFNTTANELRVYNGSTWQAASTVGGTVTSLNVTGATTLAQNPTLSAGTANGVAYLNGSKVLTTGSALTFDGTALASSGSGTQSLTVTSTATAAYLQTTGANTVNARLQSNSTTASVGTISNHNFLIQTNATNVGTFDTSGNLGLGVTPATYSGSGVLGFNIANTGNGVLGNSSNVWVSNNVSFNSGFKYARTSTATLYNQSGGAHVWSYAASGTAGNAITFTDAMTLDASGNLGVGTTSPAARLDVFTSGSTLAKFTRDLATDAVFSIGADNDGTILESSGINTMRFATSSTERARIDSSGNLLVGTTTALTAGVGISIGSATNGGQDMFNIKSSTTAKVSFAVNAQDSENFNTGAACAAVIGRNSVTGRSLNAGGTVNASGADYAEYMTKAGDFTVAKGDVVGIDAQGKLTNVFADAISFAVKSTDPSYVGGDTWGSEDALGLTKPTDESTQEEKDAFQAALEVARQKVDRIAFAGQVPVNVMGATAGQYIIPVNDNGAIKGEAVSNPTFEQYQTAVGKVIAIESDGRARIIVKVA